MYVYIIRSTYDERCYFGDFSTARVRNNLKCERLSADFNPLVDEYQQREFLQVETRS